MISEQYLIDLGLCKKNNYLTKYVKLINTNIELPAKKFSTQKHHIVPKLFYRINALEIDDSINNVVNLTYHDHCMAHYYLSRCARKKYANDCILAVTMMTHVLESKNSLSEKELAKLQDIYQESKIGASKRAKSLWKDNDFKEKQYLSRGAYYNFLDQHLTNRWVKFVYYENAVTANKKYSKDEKIAKLKEILKWKRSFMDEVKIKYPYWFRENTYLFDGIEEK